MDTKYLSIDTSIFVQENFLQGRRINTLLDLSAKGEFKLVLSPITLNEIKAQFRKRATAAFERHNEVLNNKREINLDVLRNNPLGKTIIQKLPNIKIMLEDFNAPLDQRLSAARATILPYPTLDISSVFDRYFSSSPPFGAGDKKHEFPDAFAQAHLEQWSEEHKRAITFLTKDKDFKAQTKGSITVINDIEKFVDEKLKSITEQKRLERLDKIYEVNSERIDRDITDWVEGQLEDDGLYIHYTNWLEIEDKDIEEIKVLSKTYELIASDEETLEIEVTAIVQYKVTLTIPDEDTGIYDWEDKVMLYREDTNIAIEQQDLSVDLRLSFMIIDDQDFDTGYELLSINDRKTIKIDPEGFDDHY